MWKDNPNIRAIKEVTENLTVDLMVYLVDISGFSLNTALKSPILSPTMLSKSDEIFDTYSEPSYGSLVMFNKINWLYIWQDMCV